MLGRIAWFGAALTLCVGCSALINPDEGRFGDGEDAGGQGVDAGFDAGPGFDAGGVDAGVTECESDEPFCRGDGLVTCVGGFEQVQNCQASGGYCDEGGCRAWNCEPGSRECNGDLSAVVVCDARGVGTQEIECPTGVCDEETGNCEGVAPGRCMGLPALFPGSRETVDLCARSNDETYVGTDECDMRFRANAGDQVFALLIESGGRYAIEVEDDEITRPIDTVVYLRRVCDEAGTQLGCDDDTACSSFPIPDPSCQDGRDVGHARLEIDLEPGTYYVVADAFLYDAGDGRRSVCGDVAVRVDAL